jgi:hypothetical protein
VWLVRPVHAVRGHFSAQYLQRPTMLDPHGPLRAEPCQRLVSGAPPCSSVRKV